MASIDIESSDILKNPDMLALQIVRDYDEWENARTVWKQEQDEIIKFLFATSTKTTENLKNEHNHSTHIPKLMQISQILKAKFIEAVIPTREFFDFQANRKTKKAREKAVAMEGYLLTKHRDNDFKEKIEDGIEDFVDYGNVFARVSYENQHNVLKDEEYIDIYSGPTVEIIDPMDIVFNPTAKSFDKTPKIIRSVMFLGDLERMAQENPENGYKDEIVQLLKKERSDLKSHNAEAKDNKQLTLDGFGIESQYYKRGMVEVLEFYGDMYNEETGELFKNQVITVVDRRHIIRNEASKNLTGKPHIFHAPYIKRKKNLWGMSPLANIVGMQYLINHLENQKADAFDDIIDADVVIAGLIDDIKVIGNKKIYMMGEGGNVRNLAPDVTVLNTDIQIRDKMRLMEEMSGAPSTELGVRSKGEKTKFEVAALKEANSNFFVGKANNLERFVVKILNAEVEVAQRNLSIAETIKIKDTDNGVERFLEITSDDLKQSGNIVANGLSEFVRKSKLVQTILQFEQALQMDEAMKVHFPAKAKAKIYEEYLGFDAFDLFEEYGRVGEQLELNQLTAQAQQVMNKSNVTQQEELEDRANAPVVPNAQPEQEG